MTPQESLAAEEELWACIRKALNEIVEREAWKDFPTPDIEEEWLWQKTS